MAINPLGLNPLQRHRVQRLALGAAELCLAHQGQMVYTQSQSDRWEGIADHLLARYGHWPRHADCSAFATWCLWNGLTWYRRRLGGPKDTLNGLDWKGGDTATLVKHGVSVKGRILRRGDLVFYGNASLPDHVAIYVGWGRVISFGSSSGPHKPKMRYRTDICDIRRYV